MATVPEAEKNRIKEIIGDRLMQEKYQEWVQNLRDNASVKIMY